MLLILDAFSFVLLWYIFRTATRYNRLSLFTATLAALGLAVGNNVLGHFAAPSGILLTPIVVVLAATLIGTVQADGWLIPKVLLTAAVISVHDVGTKLYAGGVHDNEGAGFMHLFLFLGLLPAYAALLYCIWQDQRAPRWHKLVAGALFPLLMGLHLSCFARLGLN